jgi:hypothetical protein
MKQVIARTVRALLVSALGVFMLFLLPGRWAFADDMGHIATGQTQQGYRFMSGGVGADERDQMMQQANQYDLTLAFAAPSGDYLSDVNVVITDPSGNEILNTTTSGPLLYAELPNGRYDVKATYNGRTHELKNVQVNNHSRVSRLFHWNVPDDEHMNQAMAQNTR